MPLIYMMFSVLTWSLFPLLSAWGINKLALFDYIFWTYVVGLFGSFVILRCLPGYQLVKSSTINKISASVLGDIILCGITVVMSFICLFTAFTQMSKASATVIFEIWPIIAIFLAPIMVVKKWDKVSVKDITFSFLAFIGAAFLIYPETPRDNRSIFRDLYQHSYVFIPLLGGVFMAISSVIKLRLSHVLRNEKHPVSALLMVQVLISLSVIIMTFPLMIWWPDKPSVYTAANILTILFIGFFVSTLGTVAYTLAVLHSIKSNIIALWYLMPIFSVIWLYLAGQGSITSFVVLGSIFIITSNLVMTVRAEQTVSYTAAVLTMLFSGVYVYFVEGLNMNDYYQAISVPIVFYTILIAFMMDRLIRSDKLEEQKVTEIVNFIERNSEKFGESSSTYVDHVMAMVLSNKTSVVDRHYQELRNTDYSELSGIYNDLDELVLSKIRGTSFAEMFLLSLIGGLTIVCSLIFRPPDIMGDSFAIVLSLTVIFIFFNLIDHQNERRNFDIERDKQGHRRLSKRAVGALTNEQLLSVVLIVAIMVAFVWLLVMKRYPDAIPQLYKAIN